MWLRTSREIFVALLTGVLVLPLAGLAQQLLDPRSSVKIDLPSDSPVALVSADLGESRATPRGGAMVLDLRMSLSLRNSTQSRIRAVTMVVSAQEVTPGGKASVAVPSLDVGPGEVFPLRIDLRLLRPLQQASGPLVQIGLDGVLFRDLSFYGPNRLDSQRAMLAWELEAQRDRQYFLSVLRAKGPEGLRGAALDSLARQSARPRLDVQVARGTGRATTSAAEAERTVYFTFLDMAGSPIEPLEGSVNVAGPEARAPRFSVKNVSRKPVRYFEIGWLVRDAAGRRYWAASVPGSASGATLQPGQQGAVRQDSRLTFARDGQPLPVEGMTGFISQVEFADGKLWIPDRESLEQAKLLPVVAPSAEEQRLTEIYRNRGLERLIAELKKF